MNFKKLNENAVTPTRGSAKAAGWDLYSCIDEDIWIQPHETVKIGTGIAVAIPDGYYGAIYARSGLATKQGLRPANAVGVIDSDYRGEIIIALHNDSENHQCVVPAERIAQLVICPYAFVYEWEEVDELDETERGTGGFGSTGSK
mgnify:CR=1 FL=1